MFNVLITLADGDARIRDFKGSGRADRRRSAASTGTFYGIIKRLLAEGLIVNRGTGRRRRRPAAALLPFDRPGRQVAVVEAMDGEGAGAGSYQEVVEGAQTGLGAKCPM
jgi:hypothetical protein